MNTIKIVKKEKEITTLKSWFELAPPEGGERQWKDKHSAKEFAKYMTINLPQVPMEVDSVISSIGVYDSSFIAEPECITDLESEGFGKRGPRHHDMLLIGEKLIIGIEAKATEELDDYVTEKYKGTSNHDLRYKGLCKSILNRELSECSLVRYQLLSASAGTLIEAQKREIAKALCLVVLFSSDITSRDHIEATKKDVEYFKTLLTRNDNGSFKTPFAPEIELYIEFLEVPLN